METGALSSLGSWESFYVIVGSSAAALTGLQFVVITLSAGSRAVRTPETVGAFGTPTIVHLCAALLISAIMSVPWRALLNAELALAASGVAGIAYRWVVIKRARRSKGYTPVLEDWLWHCVFPLIAYVTLLVAALVMRRDLARWLLVIGLTALVLLFIGIHNAWDAVTYVATQREGSDD